MERLRNMNGGIKRKEKTNDAIDSTVQGRIKKEEGSENPKTPKIKKCRSLKRSCLSHWPPMENAELVSSLRVNA